MREDVITIWKLVWRRSRPSALLAVAVGLIFISMLLAFAIPLQAPLPVGYSPVKAACPPGQIEVSAIEAPGDGHFLGYFICEPASFCGSCPISQCGVGVPDGNQYCGAPPPPPSATPTPLPPPPPSISVNAVCSSSTSRILTVSDTGAVRVVTVSNGFSTTLAPGNTTVVLNGLAGGSYTASAYSTGPGGNSATVSVTFQVDLSPPVSAATFSGAALNPPWRGQGSVTISTAPTGCLPISGTFYSINGGPFAPYGGPFALADGVYTIAYYSTTTGATEAVKTLSLHVDGTPPAISSISCGPNPTILGGAVNINALVADATSGVANWTLVADPPGGAEDVRGGAGGNVGGSFTTFYSGPYVFGLTVSDKAGNKTAIKPLCTISVIANPTPVVLPTIKPTAIPALVWATYTPLPATQTPMPSLSPTLTRTATNTLTATASPSATPTITATASASPTATASMTDTLTATSSPTAVPPTKPPDIPLVAAIVYEDRGDGTCDHPLGGEPFENPADGKTIVSNSAGVLLVPAGVPLKYIGQRHLTKSREVTGMGCYAGLTPMPTFSAWWWLIVLPTSFVFVIVPLFYGRVEDTRASIGKALEDLANATKG